MIINYFKNIISYNLRKFKSKKISYSQTGIDLILNSIFRDVNKGFYIDVGCNHPIYNNNTYLLYKKGWSGINIDLDDECIKLFNLFRRDDININAALSSSVGTKNYFFFHNKSPINTLDEITSQSHNTKVSEVKQINTNTLDNIINNTNYKQTNIDLLCIDVEGHEIDVLNGFNIKKYRPKIVVVEYLDLKLKKLEIKNLNINNILSSKLYNFMINNNYTLVNWLHSDLIFAENSFKDIV